MGLGGPPWPVNVWPGRLARRRRLQPASAPVPGRDSSPLASTSAATRTEAETTVPHDQAIPELGGHIQQAIAESARGCAAATIHLPAPHGDGHTSRAMRQQATTAKGPARQGAGVRLAGRGRRGMAGVVLAPATTPNQVASRSTGAGRAPAPTPRLGPGPGRGRRRARRAAGHAPAPARPSAPRRPTAPARSRGPAGAATRPAGQEGPSPSGRPGLRHEAARLAGSFPAAAAARTPPGTPAR